MAKQARYVPELSHDGPAKTPFACLRALVVDDMPVMAKILGKALGQLGINHDHVLNGQAALAAVEENKYDMIFMDIMMPGMNGVEAAKAIRRFGEGRITCPIIAVTTKASAEEIATYLNAGMNDCMRKPVDRVSLEVMLHDHIVAQPIDAPRADAAYDVLVDDLESVNWDTLREYSSVLKSGVKGLIQDYLTAAPILLEDLGDAVRDQDNERVYIYAGQFKSASVVFGAEKVSHLAAGLELMAGKGSLADADPLLFDLQMAYEQTQIALQKKLIILSNL